MSSELHFPTLLEAPGQWSLVVGIFTAVIHDKRQAQDDNGEFHAHISAGDILVDRVWFWSEPDRDDIYQHGWEALSKMVTEPGSMVRICKLDPDNKAWYPVGIEVPA